MNFNNFKNSLKYKVLLWFSIIVAFILFVFSYALYYFLEESINLRIQTNLYNQALNIYENNFNIKNKINYEIAVFKNNNLISFSNNFSIKDYNKYISKDEIFFINEIDEYKVEGIYVLKFKKPYTGAILVYQKDISNKAEDIEDILLVLNPILLLILIFLGNKLIDKILIPIKNISKTAKQISIDNFSYTIDITQNDDEIKELINSFNEMISRLKYGVETLDRLNSDISHELKTPLTIIQGELELALRKQRDKEYYQKSINIALKQSQNIQEIINSLLLLSKYSKQNIKETFETINLKELLLGIVSDYKIQFNNKNINLHIKNIENIEFLANRVLINFIFSNLIDNAIKYSNENTNIYISLYKKQNIYFTIKDEGIGINQEQLSKITNRFYRVDESRNKTIKGYGLGLSIVKNSVELHNGSLQISSKLNIGTTVQIIF